LAKTVVGKYKFLSWLWTKNKKSGENIHGQMKLNEQLLTTTLLLQMTILQKNKTLMSKALT